jgi:hypothetical protein
MILRSRFQIQAALALRLELVKEKKVVKDWPMWLEKISLRLLHLIYASVWVFKYLLKIKIR